VLSKLAYLTLCRFIALLAPGDAAKDLKILVLRHQLTVLRHQTPRPKLQPADRALLSPRSAASCPGPDGRPSLRSRRRGGAGTEA
jgi:hypothetical protein